MKTRVTGGVLRIVALLGFVSLLASDVALAGFRFVVWGDATDVLPHVVTNATQIGQLSIQPKFNLFVGDLYDTGFSTIAAEALRDAIDPGKSNRLSATMFPVRGNHDVLGGTGATAGWQAWFDLAATVSSLGGSNYAWMAGSNNLTYSFDYEQCHFVGMDIPGDVTLVQSSQLDWLDGDLAAAERRAGRHAFLFWHGPVYSSGSRHGGLDAPPAMIEVLNKHPIVSAIFGGHAHVFAWTHLYTNRIVTITHPFEAFIVPPVAEDVATLPDTNRCDYGRGEIRGFTTVDVDGASFTVSLHVQDGVQPVFSRTFPRPPSLNSPAVSPDRFQFRLEGEPGRRYQIESSNDGNLWLPLSTNTFYSAQDAVINEPMDPHASQRLFRCVLAR